MMKKTTFSILALCFCIFFGIASANAQGKKVTDKAANTLCTCVNEQLDKLHPAIKQMIIDMAEQGQEKAQANLMTTFSSMSKEDQTKLETGIADMQKSGFQDGIAKCFDDFKKNNPTFTDTEGLMKALHEKPKCRFVDDLMKIGEQQDKKKDVEPSKD
jgi:gas vesicle protein